MDIVETEGDSQIYAVVDVTAEVEIVLADIALCMAVELEIVGIQVVVFAVVGVEVQALVDELIHLAVGGRIGTYECRLVFAFRTLIAQLSGLDTTCIGDGLLGTFTELIGGIEDMVEIAALVIVEAEIHIRILA